MVMARSVRSALHAIEQLDGRNFAQGFARFMRGELLPA